jgi:nitrite reductase/ring-hydroxylating ferredoxin subunit
MGEAMQKIGALELFPDGAATPASYHDGRRERQIVVVRHGLTLHAYENVCPHQYLPLTYRGKQVLSKDGERLRCSNHGAEFAVADGRALSGPGPGDGLTKVPIRVAPDGSVFAGND